MDAYVANTVHLPMSWLCHSSEDKPFGRLAWGKKVIALFPFAKCQEFWKQSQWYRCLLFVGITDLSRSSFRSWQASGVWRVLPLLEWVTYPSRSSWILDSWCGWCWCWLWWGCCWWWWPPSEKGKFNLKFTSLFWPLSRISCAVFASSFHYNLPQTTQISNSAVE